MSAWDTIRTVVGEAMATVNATSANQFNETPIGTELDKLPESRINGAYSVALSGIPSVEMDVNHTIVVVMQVRIQVMFTINPVEYADPDTGLLSNEKTEYNNAVADILLIVKTLMLGEYAGLEAKEFSRGSGLRPLDDTENYMVSDLEFRLGARET